MKLTNIQESEFMAFEQLIVDRVKTMPKMIQIGFNSPYIQNNIEKLEDYLEAFMKDDGMIDGRLLGDTIQAFKPQIANWINFPRKDFRMVDLAQELLTALFGN